MKQFAFYSLFLCFASLQAHAAGDGHDKSSGGLPQLDPSTFASQAFWLVIVFTLLYLFLTFKSLPVISQTIENRNERIGNDLDSAERLRSEVASVQKAYEDSLAGARAEASDMFSKIESDIKEKSDAHANEFKDIATQKVTELEKSIMKARDNAIEEMATVAADVASEAAEKIIGVRPSEKDAQKVIKSLKTA